MNRDKIRSILTAAGVVFTEEDFLSTFWGTRFIFHKRELKKVDKTELKDHIQANFNHWCIQVF